MRIFFPLSRGLSRCFCRLWAPSLDAKNVLSILFHIQERQGTERTTAISKARLQWRAPSSALLMWPQTPLTVCRESWWEIRFLFGPLAFVFLSVAKVSLGFNISNSISINPEVNKQSSGSFLERIKKKMWLHLWGQCMHARTCVRTRTAR